MSWTSIYSTFLCWTSTVLAQEKGAAPEAAAPAGGAPAAGGGAPAGGGGGGGFGQFLIPIILMFVVFWFLMIAPERRKQKARQAMLSHLKKGDQVITSGGAIGRLMKDLKAEDREVLLQVDRDNDVRMRFLRSAIVDLVPEGGPAADAKVRAAAAKESAK